MTRAGAEGETAPAMDRVLHTSDLADLHLGFNSTATLELNIANSLWGQADTMLEEPFLGTPGWVRSTLWPCPTHRPPPSPSSSPWIGLRLRALR
ncbi:MAG: serpin family protein [Actinomycetia bacterium]|nr:serpin family protein [Actinomycetes bacterium]